MSRLKHQGIVITQTPFRISFFGGGTDFPQYFNHTSGSVIATAIDKYMYVTVNSLERFFEKRIRLSYAKLEYVDTPEELEHGITRNVLQGNPLLDEQGFIDIHTYADLPGASGVGSSSAFTVGLLHSIYSLNGIYKTFEELATEAIHIERVKLGDAGGWQDQILAAYGGFNRIVFGDNHFTVEPICIPQERKKALEKSCLLFFTGRIRSSNQIQQSVMQANDTQQLEYLHQTKMLADTAYQVLMRAKTNRELIYEFGHLMNRAWEVKRNLSHHVSNDHIDDLYSQAMKAGALGGKLCGAGGGGFLLFIVPEEKQAQVIDALAGCKQLSINFDDIGSRVIYSKVCNVTKKPARSHVSLNQNSQDEKVMEYAL